MNEIFWIFPIMQIIGYNGHIDFNTELHDIADAIFIKK